VDDRGVGGLTLEEAVRGRTVLITGASSGIGRTTALKVAAAGAKVLLVARRQELLDEAAADITAHHGLARSYPCDLSDVDAVDRLVADVLDSDGSVDIVVNNAGRSIRRGIAESYDRFHDFQRTMQLNYFGPVRLMLGLLPSMRERGSGHIINVSSIGVQASGPMFAAYLASKSAFDALSRSVSYEVVDEGVRFTTVYMPLVRTAMAAPTRLFDDAAALTPEDAADLICRAMRSRRARVSASAGRVAQIAFALAPDLDHMVNRLVSRLLFRTPGHKLRFGASGVRPAEDDTELRRAFRARLDAGAVPAEPAEVERLIKVFRRVPLFEACTGAELQRIAETAYPLSFEEGEALIVEGEDSGDCYLLIEGEAAVTVGGEPAGAVHVHEVVGERGPIEGLPRSATVTAATQVLAYAISKDRLGEIVETNPGAAAHMHRLIRARYGRGLA
jgi:NAD(P)-dependent dehydrogenase (short-subunit alcohol dehydrogenase family)